MMVLYLINCRYTMKIETIGYYWKGEIQDEAETILVQFDVQGEI